MQADPFQYPDIEDIPDHHTSYTDHDLVKIFYRLTKDKPIVSVSVSTNRFRYYQWTSNTLLWQEITKAVLKLQIKEVIVPFLARTRLTYEAIEDV